MREKACCLLFLIPAALVAFAFLQASHDQPVSFPANEHGIITLLACPPSKQNPRNSEGDTVVLKDGRILLAYTEFYAGSQSDHSEARISGKISSDGGHTWSEKFTLAENHEGLKNAMIASLLRLQDGRIMLGYNKKLSLADCGYYVRFSPDEGKTWTDEVSTMAERMYSGVYNFSPTQLSSGRILIPVTYSPDLSKENHFRIRVRFSDDDGATWQPSSTIIDLPKRGADEPGLVELKTAGSVLMIIRNQLGRIYKSVSNDYGATWSEPSPTPLKNPESPSAIARIPSTGDLVVVFNNNYVADSADHKGRRCPLTSAISRDNGETWSPLRDIESDCRYSYAYPSITFQENRVLLTYYKEFGDGGTTLWGLVFKSIPLDWFYGK